MKLECCDKCLNFSTPEQQQIRLWTIKVDSDFRKHAEPCSAAGRPEGEFELCNDCRVDFLKALKLFWETK